MNSQGKPDYTKPLETIRLIKDWSIWLVTTQTAAVGLITLFYKNGLVLNLWTGLTVAFFIISVIAGSIVLAGLPSVVGRLEENSDVYHMSLLNWGYGKGQVWMYTFVQHISFIIGLLCFIPLMFSLIPAE